jgi:predicted GNAT family N-acyltransferase
MDDFEAPSMGKRPSWQVSQVQFNSRDYEDAFALREEVLRKPLGLSLSDETLLQERDYSHFVCRSDGELVACLVLLPKENGEIRMRQVAVKPYLQGQGIGRALVEYAEEFARECGFMMMTLNARDTAIPFYDKLGYECVGEPFIEVTIPHHAMQKQL